MRRADWEHEKTRREERKKVRRGRVTGRRWWKRQHEEAEVRALAKRAVVLLNEPRVRRALDTSREAA